MKSQLTELIEYAKLKAASTLWSLLLFFLLVIPATMSAQFSYTTNNGTITITGYTGSDQSINIPANINGLQVTAIEDGAFEYSTLASVIIPNGVVYIGNDAFAFCGGLTNLTMPNTLQGTGISAINGCKNLMSIIIPNSLTNIAQSTFFGCSKLTNIFIPDSITNIAPSAFGRCSNLVNVSIGIGLAGIGFNSFDLCNSLLSFSVSTSNPFYSAVNGVLFDRLQTTLQLYPQGRNGGYAIPTNVTSIGDWSFAGCSGLTTILIPSGITNIGNSAFGGCSSLETVTIPMSVKNIGQAAFAVCSNLTSVTIGNGVTNIADFAFYSSPLLRGIYFKGSPPNLPTSLDFGPETFIGNPDLTIYYLPNSPGWPMRYGGIYTALWTPTIQIDSSLGTRSNHFGFNINWASGMNVEVEACTNPANPSWANLQTITLTNDAFYFTDPQWTNYLSRFYRLRSP